MKVLGFIYRLWNYDLNHYQYYSDGYELVELRTYKEALSYCERYKNKNLRIDRIDLDTGDIRKDFSV